MKRVFLIVLDSLGIGAMPDAHLFGDKEPNTLGRISNSKLFNIPNLIELGLGHIDGVDFLPTAPTLLSRIARLGERSMGKDTTIGHWEIAGLVSPRPMPTYPNGFPQEVISEFSAKVGRGVLCNRPYSGTQVIADFGEEHLKTGDLIVYTSADSVFQIAAHEDIVPTETLYGYCRIARSILQDEHAVGRVIARPFVGTPGAFVRTADRRDFSLVPPAATVLDAITAAGKSVYSVGKIYDIFAGRGIEKGFLTHSNAEGMAQTEQLLKEKFEGLCFINLVDFDMLYGHRQDIDGYARALSEFDAWLGNFIAQLTEDDILIITGDHGCDPGDDSTDHTREYTPFICYGKNVVAENMGTVSSFASVAATIADYLNVSFSVDAESLL